VTIVAWRRSKRDGMPAPCSLASGALTHRRIAEAGDRAARE
jgi:hypothetical protein